MSPPAESIESAGIAPHSSGTGLPNINPATGLSTDYLNHFTEAIMALEMARAMPECLDDLRAWRPKTYVEHFEDSRFRNRDVVIGAYRKAQPALRSALDDVSVKLNKQLADLCSLMVEQNASPQADATAQRALRSLRPLVARMTALVNGATDRATTQAAIDAMFGR
jgi:hypothetical protein